MQAGYDAKNPPAFARLVSGGTKLRKFSDDIMAAAQRESFALMEEQAAGDAVYNKVFSSWKKVREEYYTWFGAAERAYTEFAVSDIG